MIDIKKIGSNLFSLCAIINLVRTNKDYPQAASLTWHTFQQDRDESFYGYSYYYHDKQWVHLMNSLTRCLDYLRVT